MQAHDHVIVEGMGEIDARRAERRAPTQAGTHS